MASFIWPPQPSPPPGPRAGDGVAVELDPPELAPPDGVKTTILLELDSTGRIESALEAIKGTKAIAAKAVQVGALSPGTDPDVEAVPGGFVARFGERDIYYSDAAGAVEIYGEIKRKYDHLGGPAGLLGLPHTDELGTPDGQGRFNHFAGGSIYWTKRTGPMSVRGSIRDLWASLGWERSGLGYPVQDSHRFVTPTPSGPFIEWSEFENGFIASNLQGAWVAPYVEIPPGDLTALVRLFIDRQVHEASSKLGLHPQRESTGVVDWTEGFWRANSRAAGFRVHGFYENPVVSDTDFAIHLWLRFDLVWPPMQFTDPFSKSLVASLTWLRVTNEEAVDFTFGAVREGVSAGIHEAFFPPDGPDPAHPWVPPGCLFIEELPCVNELTREVDLLGVQVSRAGGLRLYVSPLQPPNWAPIFDWPAIRLRRVQAAVDEIWAKLDA
jgi:hypothetical protein